MKKETKAEKSKKQKIGSNLNKIYILVGIILIVIAMSLSLFLKKSNNKENPKTKEENNQVDTLKKEMDYYMLISSLTASNLPEEYFGYFFKKDKYVSSEIENEVKIYMAIRRIIAANIEKYGDGSKKITLKEKDVEQSLKEIFGENQEIKHESLRGNSCSYSGFQYDKKNHVYIETPDTECDNNTLSILMRQESYQSTEEKIELTVSAMFVDTIYNKETSKVTYNYYQDMERKNLITSSSEYNLDMENGLDSYKFTFMKVGDNYQLSLVEKILNS